ncbi:MAG: uridine diphosphate-N-acetylglucosamine-binding protein YvcK [Desulfobacteraceae bacterium]|nr:uridine diphosphate-N-acetylglucosamine-binding protein YvcK [Desulfobacteraceae bacterium]
MPSTPIRIVTIGGGSGQYALLSGLRDVNNTIISAVVSMMDSGGSTGRLRDELGTLPPGDVLKCLIALSPHRDLMRSILQKRFQQERRLRGHTAGNILLTMLSNYTGNFIGGIRAMAEIMAVKGDILPVTIDKATLVAELTDGSRIYGEGAIDEPRGDQRKKISDVFLVPHHSDAISVYPPVIDAIRSASFIIMGPGDLYTSIIPNLIVPGLKEALRQSEAPLIFIINIMTKYGETFQFKASDFVKKLEEFAGRPIDIIIYNNRRPESRVMALYANQKAEFVTIDDTLPVWQNYKVISGDLVEYSENIIRHDSSKLSNVIQQIIKGDHQ